MDLAQQFDTHKGPILAAAAAGVAVLALIRRKQTGPASTAGPAQVAPAGASAGGQAAGMYGGGSYDSTASDVYGLVQPQMESLGRQVGDLNAKLNAVPVSTPGAPTGPLAASMYAADPNNHNWIVMPNGVTAQVESDGSLFGATSEQFFGAGGSFPAASKATQNLDYYSTERNVWQAAQNQKLATATPAAK